MQLITDCIGSVPKRYWVTILAFFGNFLMLFLQLNLSIAVVEMTSNKTITTGNRTEFFQADYNWNSMEKGTVLGCFFVGYSFAFLGAFVINKFGGATVFGVALASAAVLSILSPVLLSVHLYLFILGRTLEGLFEGFATSSMADVYAHWSPKPEKARLVTFASIGKTFSAALNYPISGYLTHTYGWREMFYVSGSVTILWCIIWLIFVSNDPATDRFIKDEEKLYLKKDISFITNEDIAIPLKSILSSIPVWALFNEFFTVAWAPSFVFYFLPLYIKDVHNVNTQDVGLISGVPLLCGGIARLVSAFLADFLRSNVYNVSKVHKMYILWGELLVLITMMTAALYGDFLVSIICFCFLQIGFGFATTSYELIHLDIAGQFAGVTRSFCISWFSLGTFLNPLVMGIMVSGKTQTEWNWYFFVLCGITIYGVIVFMKFGSGELQSWAIVKKREEAESIKS